MSDRERWVIYPLLFLALGMAMKNGVEFQADQQTRQAESKSPNFDFIRCKQLQVVDDNDQPRVTLGEAPKQHAGLIMVHNAEGKPVARITTDATSGGGLIETAAANGTPQIVLTSNANSAVIGMNDRGRLIPLMPGEIPSPAPATQKPEKPPEAHENQSPANH